MIKRLLKTDLLYSSAGPPIVSGMLAIDHENRIADIGVDLFVEGIEIEYFKGALCPAFVNTHCHLELSYLKGKVSRNKGLDGFIQELQTLRNGVKKEVEMAIAKAEDEMKSSGIIAVGDISNGDSTFNAKKKSFIIYHSFIELFGFLPQMAKPTIEKGQALKQKAISQGLNASIVPHSPYSVSEDLFNLIAKEQNNAPLSIHNQETAAENQLYREGKGRLAEMLQGFEIPMDHFSVSGENSLPSYLHWLPKNLALLLVHNTFTSADDIDFAEKLHPNLYWCFCPKANLYIENRLPNINLFISAGVKCTLGTDSLASNDSLSIWEEILCLRQNFPKVEIETLIEWATINGATFLGIQQDYGSLEPGKIAKVNWLKENNELEVVN